MSSWLDVLFLIDRMSPLTTPLIIRQLMQMDDVVLLTRKTSAVLGAAIIKKKRNCMPQWEFIDWGMCGKRVCERACVLVHQQWCWKWQASCLWRILSLFALRSGRVCLESDYKRLQSDWKPSAPAGTHQHTEAMHEYHCVLRDYFENSISPQWKWIWAEILKYTI